LSSKNFNYHYGQWKKALKDQKGKCMVCFDTARNSNHKTCDCPILKNLGFMLEKQSAADNPPRDATLRVASDAPVPTHSTNPPQAPSQLMDSQSGSASMPSAFAASMEQASYDSGNEFIYKGKADGAMYGNVEKSKNTSSVYLHASCRHTTLNPHPTTDCPPTHKMGGATTTDPVISMGVPLHHIQQESRKGLTPSISLKRSSPSSTFLLCT
jgi:hypothetical protein